MRNPPTIKTTLAIALLAGACLSGCAAVSVPLDDGPAYRSPAYPTPAYLGPQAYRGAAAALSGTTFSQADAQMFTSG